MRKSPKNKVVVLVALIVLTGAAVWFLKYSKFPKPTSNPPVPEGTVSGPKSHEDPYGRFFFSYPADFARIEAQQPYYGLKHVEIALMSEQASYHPMNYGQDSWLVVSSETLTEAACFRPADGQIAFHDEKMINGVTFRVASSTDAGMGNRYESNLYRTYRDGTCYEIATTLHYASDFTDIDEAAMRYSQDEARSALNTAVESFQF